MDQADYHLERAEGRQTPPTISAAQANRESNERRAVIGKEQCPQTQGVNCKNSSAKSNRSAQNCIFLIVTFARSPFIAAFPVDG
jgi:hypothetical protein